MQARGKRKVSSCIPCYKRKQKCNRQYPCNHCTRRRRPDDCAYYPSETPQPVNPSTANLQRNGSEQSGSSQPSVSANFIPHDMFPDVQIHEIPPIDLESLSLAEVFGYSEDSHTNTLALLRLGGPFEEGSLDDRDKALSNDIVADFQQIFEKMPDRSILDFLVRYFVAEVNWIDQLIYPPWFLEQYQLWWDMKQPSTVFDIEFAVVILRMCSYASEFLPSQSHTIESIRGMPLGNIRKLCDKIADQFYLICNRIYPRGSLLRVQHLLFAGLKLQCDGQVRECREILKFAIQTALRIGIGREATLALGLGELEKEMRRRVLCNLYIWDSLLYRQQDRIPIFPCLLSPENMPRMQLGPELDNNKEVDDFTGHLLQARLANFWKAVYADCCHFEYDVVAAEERYEKFCHEYLPIIPSPFALQPDTQYDNRSLTLPKQRSIFHISIFESLCYNFRPVLMQKPSHIQSLPKYKQVLLLSQQKALAIAALSTLRSTSSLHALVGNSYTRLVHIVRPTFEAAVLLVYLSMYPSLLVGDRNQHSRPSRLDPLRGSMIDLREDQCTIAIQKALHCLQTLADVSHMAEIGSRALMQLLQKTKEWSSITALGLEKNGLSQTDEALGNPPLLNFTNSSSASLTDITMIAAFDHSGLNWEASPPELGNLLSSEYDR